MWLRDDSSQLAIEQWVSTLEAASVEAAGERIHELEAANIESGNNKFAYYGGTTKNAATGKIPQEYGGHQRKTGRRVEDIS